MWGSMSGMPKQYQQLDTVLIYQKKHIPWKVLQTKIDIMLKGFAARKAHGHIAIMLDRTPDLLVAVLACFSGGYPFLPIDPSMPFERIEQILKDGTIDFIVTTKKYQEILQPAYPALTLEEIYERNGNSLESSETYNKESSIAYIIFTSGTTGKPKGIEVSRASVCNLIEGMQKRIPFPKSSRILCEATVSFDMFIVETIVAFCMGFTIVLADDREYQNPKLLVKLIQEEKVNVLQMTPSKLKLLLEVDKDKKCLEKAELLLIGGETFPSQLLTELKTITKAAIYNMYGPTEATVWISACELTFLDEIHLGEALENNQIYLMDEQENLIEDGAVGEIVLTGKSLAEGYYGDKALTEEKFVLLKALGGQRAYKTGDLGSRKNGHIFFHGRKDDQMKIHGFRVEAGEIETVLTGYPGVEQAAVVYGEEAKGEGTLAAFLKGTWDGNEAKLRSYLAQYLPQYMIPVKYVSVEKWEYTFNGKLDKKKLWEQYFSETEEQVNETKVFSEGTEGEILKVIWDNVNHRIFGELTPDTKLSAVGIDSITFVKVLVALEEHFDFQFEDEKMHFGVFPTVRDLVAYVQQTGIG